MARDLNDAWDWIGKIISRISRLESGSMLENSSITSGRMRFIGGLLRIDSGGRLEIEGTLQIDGATEVTGTFTVTGPWSLDGDGNITGDVTVTGDLTVTGGGKINVGTAMVLDPSVSSGALVFSNGAQVFTSGSTIQVFKGSRVFSISDSEIVMTDGARTVRISSAGIALLGLGTYGRTTVTPNVPVGTLMANATTGVVTRAI